MRRRVKDGEVPATLAAFTPSEWPGATLVEKAGAWKQAMLDYSDAHGWPGGPLEALTGALDVVWLLL